MKLGMSQACYRWINYPSLRRDNFEYRRSGRPLPYLSTVRTPREGEGEVAWLLEKVSELGLDALYLQARLLVDRAGAEAFKAEMADRSIEHIGGISFNVAADQAEWESGGFENVSQEIQLLGWSGARIASAVHNEATRHNHFSHDPPVDVQIERAIGNFRSLIPLCEKHGVVLAFENHLDYRLSEIVQVVEAVDSPWLRINLDTANSISVIEDPMDAARIAAKYTVTSHLKDMRVQPATGTGEPRVYWAPLGRGDVPIDEILGLLHSEAPDPSNFAACIEVAPPPDQDPDVWMRGSIDWIRETCGQYFS